MATIWLGQDYLIKRSVVDSNVEYDKLVPVINLVQRKYVKRTLGTDLYNALDTHILAFINSATAIPAAYKYLLDEFINEMIVYYTLMESSPTFKYRYTNRGLVSKEGDGTSTISTSDLDFMMGIMKSNAEMFQFELIKYIQVNATSYPEYGTNITNGIYPENESYDTDVFLGDFKYKYTNDAGDFRK